LGVVLYEMVAGELPFAGATTSDVIAAILKTEPPPLSSKSLEVPAELERIVTKALRKDAAERYQSVRDMQFDLRTLKQELEIQIPVGAGSVKSPRAYHFIEENRKFLKFSLSSIAPKRSNCRIVLEGILRMFMGRSWLPPSSFYQAISPEPRPLGREFRRRDKNP
jgi:serine/threonine protein kinase